MQSKDANTVVNIKHYVNIFNPRVFIKDIGTTYCIMCDIIQD